MYGTSKTHRASFIRYNNFVEVIFDMGFDAINILPMVKPEPYNNGYTKVNVFALWINYLR